MSWWPDRPHWVWAAGWPNAKACAVPAPNRGVSYSANQLHSIPSCRLPAQHLPSCSAQGHSLLLERGRGCRRPGDGRLERSSPASPPADLFLPIQASFASVQVVRSISKLTPLKSFPWLARVAQEPHQLHSARLLLLLTEPKCLIKVQKQRFVCPGPTHCTLHQPWL